MNIEINSVNFTASQRLTDFINKKTAKLYNIFDGIIGVNVTLRLEKSQDLENKIAEISVDVPNSPNMFVKKKNKTFEESIDEGIDALKRQITKHKEKVRGV